MSSPASWADAKRVFEAALDLPEAERAAFAEKACAGNAALLEEVRSLLSWHKGSTGFLETPASRLGKPVDVGGEAARLVGKSIGAWRILDVIGSGGMGVVYRAERADAAFRRHAALKVVRTGPDSPQIMQRFQLERETLAALDHPNIARLMDGGTTPDGQPFFVMELVDGKPIDIYCEEHALSIDERLDLFRKVCAGVQYAHENLVVHRDIKPDNILVTNDGVPKLLDFGVAKILSPGGAQPEDPSATAATWMMTPDYASPEQVSGRASTTATDVYSLGVLLHVLLTGARPYTLTGATPADIEKQLLAFTLIRPSERAESSPEAEQRALRRGLTAPKLARRLRGDLDAIVMRALGRTPASRYSSVEQLAEDVARHRANYPVDARRRTARYATRLFVRRHRVALAVATLLVAVIIGGIVAVLWQASLAAAARMRAERRFNDVRRLAGSFIFDVYDAIDDVPGTTPARQLIVKNAVTYLESLAREAAGDIGLQRELADAFVRVGDVQGNPTRANVGDPTGAIASYQRAIGLAQAVRNAAASDIAAIRTLAGAHKQRGDVLALTGNKDGALADAEAAADLYAQIAGRNDASIEDKTASGVASIKLGDLLGNPNFENLGRTDSAMMAYRKALDSFRRLDQANPTSLPVRRYLGVTLERIGTMQAVAKQWSDAAASYQESFEIRRGLAEREPTHRDIQRDLGIAHEKLAEVLLARGDAASAVGEQRLALAVYERLASADPADANAGRTVAIGRENVADALRQTGKVTEALDLYRKALDVHRGFRAKDPHNVQAACDAARVAETLGDALSAAEAPGACAAWRESQGARQSLPPSTGSCAAPADVQRMTTKLARC
jgi:non-specific serine/threonine protein kinase/serine/threonine-protein kinase